MSTKEQHRISKTDLVDHCAAVTGATKATSKKIIDEIFDTITRELEGGNAVVITGFGTFEVRERQARSGVKPGTTERITIPAKRYPAFKAGANLKDAVETTPF